MAEGAREDREFEILFVIFFPDRSGFRLWIVLISLLKPRVIVYKNGVSVQCSGFGPRGVQLGKPIANLTWGADNTGFDANLVQIPGFRLLPKFVSFSQLGASLTSGGAGHHGRKALILAPMFGRAVALSLQLMCRKLHTPEHAGAGTEYE